jgi:hypothetical protein
MHYGAVKASAGGDNITLAKLFIRSLENASTSWYARL